MESARRAAPADLEVLRALISSTREVVAGERGGPLWLAREAATVADDTLVAAMDDPDRLVLVGCLDEVPVGYLLAEHQPATGDVPALAVIQELAVEPAARGVGVGEALMDAVLRWARVTGSAGLDSIALPGNRALKNLFERYGLVARAIVVHKELDVGEAGG